MSIDDNIASDIANIKLSAESLDTFFTGLSDAYPNLYDTLRGLLRDEGIGKSELRELLREEKKAAISLAHGSHNLLVCNVILLALILWRVW